MQVLGQRPMNGPAQSQISIGRVRLLEVVLEPPAGVAVHEAANLRGGKYRSGFDGTHRWFAPLMLIKTVIAMDLMASASNRTT